MKRKCLSEQNSKSACGERQAIRYPTHGQKSTLASGCFQQLVTKSNILIHSIHIITNNSNER